MASIKQRIEAYNATRPEGDQLPLKYERMRESALAFFRGSCHLFYEDLAGRDLFHKQPAVWLCGDLHLENFGWVRDDAHRLHFGINDFDETVLSSFTWDVTRMATSILLTAADKEWNIDGPTKEQWCYTFLDSYFRTIWGQKAVDIQPDDTTWADANDREEAHRHQDYRQQFEKDGKGNKTIRLEAKKYIAFKDADKKEKLIRAFSQWARKDPRFQEKVLDAVKRIAGNGSLGIKRFALLTDAPDAPPQIIDMKEALRPSALPYIRPQAARWKEEADRIVWACRKMQRPPVALLGAMTYRHISYLVKALQPGKSPAEKVLRLFLQWRKNPDKSPDPMTAFLTDAGRAAASAHLRSCGHKGAATAAKLAAAVKDPTACRDAILETAGAYCAVTIGYYQEFCS